jgi:ketosteroid isomerase-like protein
MSAENVELIRKGYERDAESMGPQWETIDPEFEYHTLPNDPDAGVFHGHDGFKEMLSLWSQQFDEMHVDAEEYVDAGDYVIVSSRVRGIGRTSGAAVDTPLVFVWKFRGGLRVECREYATKEAAVEAVRVAQEPAEK